MPIKNLGNRIFQARKNKGFTQTQLANLLNTTPGYISEMESGKAVPGGKILLSLKQYLGVSSDWLLTGETPEGVEVYNPDEKEFAKKLLRIMRTKQEKTVVAIKNNLDAFLDNPDKEKEHPLPVKKKGGMPR